MISASVNEAFFRDALISVNGSQPAVAERQARFSDQGRRQDFSLQAFVGFFQYL